MAENKVGRYNNRKWASTTAGIGHRKLVDTVTENG